DILAFWKSNAIFERSVANRAGSPRFVFYEGPPTANGMPHPGHALTRAMKDVFPRYKTMTGHLVERKAGWDTHGLPVEVEVSKELGIHTKAEIEAYGMEAFVRKCIDSVFRYTAEWQEMSDRLGFWIDTDGAYCTYHKTYVESVWWSLKTLFERGQLYQGHKIVWWWPQGGTALSAGEVGEGYREVDDPSVYVRFPLVDEPGTSLLIWTTTPWTLLSNQFAAVHPDLTYAVVRDDEADERLIVAADLVEKVAALEGRTWVVERTTAGRDLVGRRYRPPFDVYYETLGDRTAALTTDEVLATRRAADDHIGWRVVAAPFVTIDSGTGVVHEAPAFGEVDFDLLVKTERPRFADANAVPLLCAVAPDGTFTAEAGEALAGRYIKDADKDIIKDLRERGLLYHRAQIRHEYPFCPRAPEDPLIQYARASWFVRTSDFKEDMLANNDAIQWLPEHIKEGRFGDFLRNNVDWALSRERFWGTPLPIWRCDATGRMEAIGSLEELYAKPGVTGTEVWEAAKSADPTLPDDLRIHKPYIDALTYDSPYADGARMRRVTEVIDCWWDAGSMPFAQWGFPHVPGSQARFREMFPADFISEAIDQTRGWFYGLTAISTLLFGDEDRIDSTVDAPVALPPHPFRTCIVLGFMMGEDGLKMSKRTKNYRSPGYVFDTLGADAMRWYFYSAQPPWTSVRFQEAAIRDAQREFLMRLYNVWSFFNIYARLDGFDPGIDPSVAQGGSMSTATSTSSATGWRPLVERAELDRWITGELHRTIRTVRASMDRFENHPAAGALITFVDALSNWYVRRSRDRFWGEGASQDKWDAYNTLYEVLVDVAKVIAPFTPFFAERLYRNLVGEVAETAGGDARGDASGDASGDDFALVASSVHFCDYPTADEARIDEALSAAMAVVRDVVSAGHSARADAGLKVRQPLRLAEVVVGDAASARAVERHADLIAEELNVQNVEPTQDADRYVTFTVKPNFRALGPRFGPRVQRIGAVLGAADPAAVRRALVEDGRLVIDLDGESVTLTPDDVEVRLSARDGFAAAEGKGVVVVLSTAITPELRELGLVREILHHIQAARKADDLPYQARIAVDLETSAELAAIAERHAETIRRECLVVDLAFGAARDGAAVHDGEIDGAVVRVRVRVVG
ncbi:MAG: isoleucine--tRNA ligase, partial [Ardenticatenales bacterium]